MMRKVALVVICVIALAGGRVIAEEVEVKPPQKLVAEVTAQVLTALRAINAKSGDQSEAVSQKIEEIIVPHLDFTAMSKKVLGKHWRRADADQRQQFIQEFKLLLIRTYQTSLSKYSEEEIKFLPFRPGKKPDQLAVVKTEVLRSSGPKIPINYSLFKKPGSPWKVYDIGIEGISLVTNYRSSFSREIEKSGIEALIKSLAQRNQEPAVDSQSKS